MSSTFPPHITSLKHIIICGIYALPDLCQLWETFCQELAAEGLYQACIGGMRLRLVELQVEDGQAWKIKTEKLGRNWKNSDRILYHKSLPYIPEIIRTQLISRHHNDPLAGHFGIEKTQELVTRKYYWETLRYDVEVYVRYYDICLASKAVRHKLYGNLQ